MGIVLDDGIYCILFAQLGTIGNYSGIADLHTLRFTVTHALGVLIFTSCIRDSSVGIATGYGLDDQGGGSSSPGRTSYKIGTGSSFPGAKRQGREADHSPPTSTEVKKMWIYTSTPPYVFMA
jgi:hypothetical protein